MSLLRAYLSRCIGSTARFAVLLSFLAGLPGFQSTARAEVILQYFGTSWNDIADRMPELAEAGYSAFWFPPPFKAGAGTWDVGFGTHDRFDLGDKYQMGTVPTKYGTRDDLLNLMKIAHRFGFRVYFDNVMAHNGGPTPGYDANSSIYAQPGFVPEDFHMLVTDDGFYRHSGGIDWGANDEWQILHKNPFGLDIAHESPNASFGPYIGAQFPKYVGVRHPDNPEYYLDTDLAIATNFDGGAVYTFANKEPFEDVGYGTNSTGAGNGKFDWDDTNLNGQHDSGETSEPFTDTGLDPSRVGWQVAERGYGDGVYNMGNIVSEDVNGMLNRAVRWFVDTAHADGFRLDAVKHVPDYFFGKQWGGDKDYSNWGYNGQIQEQYNITHGYSDWNNHRDTVFNDRSPRDDALLYGEHLGSPPAEGGYLDAGMRIASDSYLNNMNGNIGNNLTWMDQPGYGTYGGHDTGMKYVMSHDNNYLWDGGRPAAHAVMLLSAGIPIVYTDGYNQSGPPDWFPKPSYVPFLGQWGSAYMPNLLEINRNFARGDQIGKWSDTTLVVYERRDKSDNWGMSDSDGTTLFFAQVKPYSGFGRDLNSIGTTFPEGATLVNYSYHGGKFKAQVQSGVIKDLGGGSIIVPDGGYFAFSWANPESPSVWNDGYFGEVYPIRFLDDGEPVDFVMMPRTDGRDGEPSFNPYGLPDSDSGDYTYYMPVPRITGGTNVTIEARADGSAENIILKLDGGIDVNSHMNLGPTSGELRDNPPAISTDVYLGYEQMEFKYRVAEKFAAADTARNIIGSPGAETYIATVGVAGVTINNGGGMNTDNSRSVTWAYHEPTAMNETNTLQMNPAPESAAGSPVDIWVKIGYAGEPQNVYIYYTTNGTSFPEGSAGLGKGETLVAAAAFDHWGAADGSGTPDWWKATLPALPSGTTLRYKVGVSRPNAGSIFPWSEWDINFKTTMETFFQITNLNMQTLTYFPHNNYGDRETGLEEGIHFVRTRALLDRSGRAPIYKTFTRTFYYDTQPPQGEILYPQNDGDDLYGSTYGVVVRGDRTVKEAWYRITDADPGNDDTNTLASNGNGAWVKAQQVTANPGIGSEYPFEWKFEYVNIPSSNQAVIEVRFVEVSSSTNFALSDTAGHFTTLTRTVDARGPDYNLYVAYPQYDGEVIGPGYGMKANFSKALASGISEQDLINSFSLYVDSNLVDRALYSIAWDETFDHHALAFTMPNYYNGIPDFLHELRVELDRDGYPFLETLRQFKSQPVLDPTVTFIKPPLTDEDDNAFELLLPSVAVPVQTQRQYEVVVDTSTNVLNLNLYFLQGSGTLVAATNNPVASTNGAQQISWTFTWNFPLTNDPAVLEGTYKFQANADTDGDTNSVEAFSIRSVPVILREVVNVDTNDVDDDDDGISDYDELNYQGLPAGEYTTWNNGDVHIWSIYGKTEPLQPDTDGDGLPDGLESGWRGADAGTDTNADTNADGWPNFIPDLDPPFFNTCDNIGKVPNTSACDEGDKTLLLGGTMTDPTNPDTDGDGLRDGVEDANRNGWVDGDGAFLPTTFDPWLERDWPDGVLGASDTWYETDPNNPDTDGDGLRDGYDEDKNSNRIIDGDTNTNRIYDAGEAWTETDPLNSDTDGDGLPDGWEVAFGLGALDNGSNDLATAAADDGSITNGPSGDPDGDGIINLSELISGLNPNYFDSGAEPPEGDITIGPKTNVIVAGGIVNDQQFTDWTYEHLIALDPYDSLDGAYDGGDVYYRPWASDGLESSRDLVAFYAHDGGDITNGGDGKFYFRVDLHNLQDLAEASGLDLYVVVDTGNINVGERLIVDSMDVLTDMRWELVAVVYDSAAGAVYVNTPGSPDTDELTDTINYAPTDVDRRDQNHPTGFIESHFNHELDAIEFSISRQALLDAGWSGNFNQLNFQVFTTRDGTDGGPGELDGPDIADSIRTDWIANDYASTKHSDQWRYDERNKLTTLVQWVGMNSDNDRGKRMKVISMIHGNQTMKSARDMMKLINSGYSSGYHRPIDVHEAYTAPLALKITPTLASALQWARVDPNKSPSWRDGPSFNARIAGLASNGTINLLASTFAEHMLPYFTDAFNQDNVALANTVLESIYGAGNISDKVLWAPERLLDSDSLQKIANMGYSSTFIDQNQHLLFWFGRSVALGVDAYRINRIENIYCFPIANTANDYRFQEFDGGPSMAMRKLLNTQVRQGDWSGQHPQVLVMMSNWSDFGDYTSAANYDKLVRWFASKGWIQFVTPDDILEGNIDISLPPDGGGDYWNNSDRGTGLNLAKRGHDWIQYASQDNYDNWYLGSGLNEGLLNKVFEIRSGVNVTQRYGMLYLDGQVLDAWNAVNGLSNMTNSLGYLARSVLHASTFQTAFHDQTGGANMAKFSTGEFAYPDGGYDGLISFARYAQAQTRFAAIYAKVEAWASAPPSGTVTEAMDIDLDGEQEYLLYNERLFVIFEAIGGRAVASFARDLIGGDVYQASGNLVSYSKKESEEEGLGWIDPDGTVDAHRTSLFKDQWAGTSDYINDLYTVTDRTNGWQFTSGDGALSKWITLADDDWRLEADYTMSGALAGVNVYIRHGLSPNLWDLMIHGQQTLDFIEDQSGVLTLRNTNYNATVFAQIGYSDAGHSAGWNSTAADDGNGHTNWSYQLRNQALTEQVEVWGSDSISFSIGFKAHPSDWDGDGMANTYEDASGFDSSDPADGPLDEDGDGVSNAGEYIAGTDGSASGGADYPYFLHTVPDNANGFKLQVPTENNRRYHIYYYNGEIDDVTSWQPASMSPLKGDGSTQEWTDDGTATAPHPSTLTSRVYKIDVRLP